MAISTHEGNNKCIPNFDQKPEAEQFGSSGNASNSYSKGASGGPSTILNEMLRSCPQSSHSYARISFQIRSTNAFFYILSNSVLPNHLTISRLCIWGTGNIVT
jgi:hypothetical protein